MASLHQPESKNQSKVYRHHLQVGLLVSVWEANPRMWAIRHSKIGRGGARQARLLSLVKEQLPGALQLIHQARFPLPAPFPYLDIGNS